MKQALKMKLILVTCIVASAFAAPPERTKRDILPGDPRYDAKHHQHHTQYEQLKTEVEIAKALGGYAGTFESPEINFGFSGLETGDSFGDIDFLKYNINADKEFTAVNSDRAIDVTGSKVFERLTSVSDASSASPKIESATDDKSNNIAEEEEADSSTSNSVDLASRTKIDDADKESSENADKTKLESKSASEESSSDASKTTETKSATVDGKTSAKAVSNVVSLRTATDSLTAPFFDSSFDSSFSSFDQIGYNPSFRSFNGYTPEFSGYSLSDEFYKGYGGLPLNLDTYSGLGKEIKGSTIGFNSPVDFSPLSPLDFTKNIPYIAPSTFSSFQPDIEITRGSYTSGSQLTDSNGGYVY